MLIRWNRVKIRKVYKEKDYEMLEIVKIFNYFKMKLIECLK